MEIITLTVSKQNRQFASVSKEMSFNSSGVPKIKIYTKINDSEKYIGKPLKRNKLTKDSTGSSSATTRFALFIGLELAKKPASGGVLLSNDQNASTRFKRSTPFCRSIRNSQSVTLNGPRKY